MTTPTTKLYGADMTDELIIERCKAAGIKWVPPEDERDEYGIQIGYFPGLFDMASMEEMRALLSASKPAAIDGQEAVLDGWAQGVEAAAKVCDRRSLDLKKSQYLRRAAQDCALEIRALVTAAPAAPSAEAQPVVADAGAPTIKEDLTVAAGLTDERGAFARMRCIVDGDEIAAMRKAAELMCGMGYHAEASQITCFLSRSARAAARPAAPADDAHAGATEPPPDCINIALTYLQVSALYVHLVHRQRPDFGWIEAPLLAIEEALKPAHNAIHDRSFNAMNRQFFGDDRMRLSEAPLPTEIAAPTPVADSGVKRFEEIARRLDTCARDIEVTDGISRQPKQLRLDANYLRSVAAARPVSAAAAKEGAMTSLSHHSRAMLLNVLWHHQGGSSLVGQPLRSMLGIGPHGHMTGEQVEAAKWIDGLLAEAKFKNFHRALCERFDYVHDEKDWQRDQVSLIEWIAKKVTTTTASADAEDAWQPIETAPVNGMRVMLFDASHNGGCAIGHLSKYPGRQPDWINPGCHKLRPTHWMPLPSAPIDAARKGARS